jgi:hypothetical protein
VKSTTAANQFRNSSSGADAKMAGSVEFPYADDWYDDPKMKDPMENPSELWLKRDHKRDLAFRPLETALEKSEAPPNWWTPLLSSGGSGKVSNGPETASFYG